MYMIERRKKMNESQIVQSFKYLNDRVKGMNLILLAIGDVFNLYLLLTDTTPLARCNTIREVHQYLNGLEDGRRGK